jgi:hypothetical protein
MVLLQGGWTEQQLLYDVSDPVHPRLICNIVNTSAHLLTGAEMEWLKPISSSETDVVVHSLGPGNDALAGSFPFRVTSGAWLPDRSVMAYTTPVPLDNDYFFAGGTQVWLYSHGQTVSLFKYRHGIGGCTCRFGMPRQVLSISPDGEYLVAGWVAGKGSQALSVYRIGDRSLVATMEPEVYGAFWDRTGHRLFLNRFGSAPSQAWTPEAGLADLAGAAAWSYFPGVSPDSGWVAYTAYSDTNFQEPRVYVYDRKAGSTRMIVDKLRTQIVFIKAGWVWYLEERPCLAADSCAGSTGKVFAMQLSGGTETAVTFAAGEDPLTQSGDIYRVVFGPGEFWPAT